MIVHDRPRFWDLANMLGSVLPHILPNLFVLVTLSAVMVGLEQNFMNLPLVDATPFTVMGIALSLFLGFRNNAAYDRWWEARKLWGGLLADLRTLARECVVFVPDPVVREMIQRDSIAFIHLHRANLRGLVADPEGLRLASELMDQPNPACAALDRMNAVIATSYAAGGIDGFGARALTTRLASMALQQAGCERIVTTPIPYVYSLLIYRTTYVYCLLLPLALISSSGGLTPLFVGIVAYLFLGLAEVTEGLSHPFGMTENALPLDSICRVAEISLAPHLGEAPPQPPRPTNFILS